MSMVMENPSINETSTRDWLCPIPSHWDIRRNGRLFRELKLPGQKDLPILTVSIHDGVAVRDMDDQNHRQMMEDKEKYQSLRKGDIAYNMMRMWQGAVGVAPVDGLVSPAYVCARPCSDVNPKYYEYLFRTPIYMGEVEGYSRGIVSDRNRLYWEGFKQIPSPYPPIEEQDAIVAFLDRKLEEIDRFILNKRHLIELLNEKIGLVQNRAVTLGVDHNSTPSPTEILGWPQAPSHWNPRRLGELFEIQSGCTPSKNEAAFWTNGDVPWVSPKDMKVEEIFDSQDKITDLAVEQSSISLIEPPVLLIVVRGMILIRTIPTSIARVQLTINQDMKALRCNDLVTPEYLQLLFKGLQRLFMINIEESGHGTRKFPTNRLRRIEVMLPPPDEQLEITLAVEQERKIALARVLALEKEIGLMNEFRTSLIAEAVTGKIDLQDGRKT